MIQYLNLVIVLSHPVKRYVVLNGGISWYKKRRAVESFVIVTTQLIQCDVEASEAHISPFLENSDDQVAKVSIQHGRVREVIQSHSEQFQALSTFIFISSCNKTKSQNHNFYYKEFMRVYLKNIKTYFALIKVRS